MARSAKTTNSPAAAKTSRPVTLKHLAAALAEEHQLTKRACEAVLGDLVGTITKHLKKGEQIRIAGLGILQVRKRAARMGRNPRQEKQSNQGQQKSRIPSGQGFKNGGLTVEHNTLGIAPSTAVGGAFVLIVPVLLGIYPASHPIIELCYLLLKAGERRCSLRSVLNLRAKRSTLWLTRKTR